MRLMELGRRADRLWCCGTDEVGEVWMGMKEVL